MGLYFKVSSMKSSFGLVSYFLPSLGEEGRRDNSVKSPMFVYLYMNKKKKNLQQAKSLLQIISNWLFTPILLLYSLFSSAKTEMNEKITTSKEI